jgi:hypothetical protein
MLLPTAARLIAVKRFARTPRATRMDAGVVVMTAFSAFWLARMQLSLLNSFPRRAPTKLPPLWPPFGPFAGA